MRRRTFLAASVAAAAAALSSRAAIAHSLETLQQDLFDQEKYFQIKEEPAPEFALQDAKGNSVSLADLRGKVMVLHFIYASCPDVCPLHAEKIAEIQEMVNITPMKDRVEFITVTTDPARDGPEVLEGYGQAHGLDPVNWTFLTSGPSKPEDTTRKLAEQFGHSFTKSDDGFQTHSVVTHLIDQNGEWVANFHGLGFEPTNLVMFINGLTNANVPHHEPDPSLWGRVRSFF
ncbi:MULTISPECIES: SCO family protein [Aurantimonadaceae]|uniref:SCO family protein n=1 Tax=Jiella pelagia TaxID=2986949 RepID=A0ABY7C750_9HYPH|nr:MULTISPECIES: SCO family protein [Aurantimonadaceae]ORE97010.1 oxidoreductase [Aurantimonas sp. 22II-16-19i]WAP71417.1 SCO family protein [Jiella pelagia]